MRTKALFLFFLVGIFATTVVCLDFFLVDAAYSQSEESQPNPVDKSTKDKGSHSETSLNESQTIDKTSASLAESVSSVGKIGSEVKADEQDWDKTATNPFEEGEADLDPTEFDPAQ
ncbi:MAG: hypothetical protein NG737_00760 [Omnitrophica bacterium]|nr:hypothetical protein [Candidatus Omnitrophota bacterium]